MWNTVWRGEKGSFVSIPDNWDELSDAERDTATAALLKGLSSELAVTGSATDADKQVLDGAPNVRPRSADAEQDLR